MSVLYEHILSKGSYVCDTLEISQGTTEIPLEAHRKNWNWECVDMRHAHELKTIGERAFARCKSLARVFFAPNLQVIQAQAFQHCESLNVVRFDNLVNLTEIGAEAFTECVCLTEMSLPPTITTLDQGVFSQCVKLQKVRLPPNLKTIPSHAFEGCVELRELNLESTVVSNIGKNAFASCNELTEVVVPPTLETIGDYSFLNCKGLQRVHGLSVARRLHTLGREAFRDCIALVSFDLSHTILEEIQAESFRGCLRLYEIVLNAKLMDIASNAFSGCSTLRKVYFHQSGRLEKIGAGAFRRCRNLYLMNFPSSLESIQCDAFSECWNLRSVSFQEGLWYIGEDAFFGCESLADVTIPSSVDYLMENSFDGDYLERIDTNGDRLELSIRLWSMYPDAFVGMSEEKWCSLYSHHDKNFCFRMTKKDHEKLDCVKQIFANNLYELVHWSISVGSVGT